VRFATTNIPGDTIILNVAGLMPPPEDQGYLGWLYSRIEDRWLALGPITLDGSGSGEIQLTPTAASGLHARFNAVALSLEANAERPTVPQGPILYSGAIPDTSANALYQILVEWGAESVAGMSLLDIARIELAFAEDHAARAVTSANSGSVPEMHVSSEHVYNILQGGEQDINGDGSNTNPSDLKFGLFPATTAMSNVLVEAAFAEGIDAEHQMQLLALQACANNAAVWSEVALVNASQFASIEDVDLTLIEDWYAGILQIGPGQDTNDNAQIEGIDGECGLNNIEDFAVSVNSITILEGIAPSLPPPSGD
jgi:hypothetical protein